MQASYEAAAGEAPAEPVAFAYNGLQPEVYHVVFVILYYRILYYVAL